LAFENPAAWWLPFPGRCSHRAGNTLWLGLLPALPELETTGHLRSFYSGEPSAFVDWINVTITVDVPAFDRMVVAEDIESLVG
jgi:hypothetical protein